MVIMLGETWDWVLLWKIITLPIIKHLFIYEMHMYLCKTIDAEDLG